VLDALRQESFLITGGGGSIGSALAKRLAALGVRKLVLLETSDSNLYALERDLSAATNRITPILIPILGSAADEALLSEIFSAHSPRIVFHAAAFKHVPLMEEQPLAAIANNIFATESLTRAAASYGARVVLLSTDKAVEPASVMGATKRVAERIVLGSGGTALRLGNVLASRDSVTTIFARQIARGAPVTVTDATSRRYFLTIGEAVNLLLTAAAYRGPAALLAPVLLAAHSVQALAMFMARELRPDCPIAIEFTGPRAGDKASELLWKAGDRTRPAGIEGLVSVETAELTEAQFRSGLTGLRAALDARDVCDALAYLCALVPDYTPSQAVQAFARQCGAQACL
jgi:FlaA1/EpsC-like NDP-sugar epimerase